MQLPTPPSSARPPLRNRIQLDTLLDNANLLANQRIPRLAHKAARSAWQSAYCPSHPIRRVGHLGDAAAVGAGVSELRIHVGPGYRVYFARRGDTVYLLLAGGDKSTQPRDIRRAQAMLAALPPEEP